MEEEVTQTEIDELIDVIQGTVRQVIRRMRAEAPFSDLSMSQTSALSKLDVPGGLTNAELARAEGVKPQSMSTIVADLEAEGFIQRNPDPADGRRIVLSLTETGKQVRQTRQVAKQQWWNSMIEQLSPEERQDLRRGFSILGRITK